MSKHFLAAPRWSGIFWFTTLRVENLRTRDPRALKTLNGLMKWVNTGGISDASTHASPAILSRQPLSQHSNWSAFAPMRDIWGWLLRKSQWKVSEFDYSPDSKCFKWLREEVISSESRYKTRWGIGRNSLTKNSNFRIFRLRDTCLSRMFGEYPSHSHYENNTETTD